MEPDNERNQPSDALMEEPAPKKQKLALEDGGEGDEGMTSAEALLELEGIFSRCHGTEEDEDSEDEDEDADAVEAETQSRLLKRAMSILRQHPSLISHTPESNVFLSVFYRMLRFEKLDHAEFQKLSAMYRTHRQSGSIVEDACNEGRLGIQKFRWVITEFEDHVRNDDVVNPIQSLDELSERSERDAYQAVDYANALFEIYPGEAQRLLEGITENLGQIVCLSSARDDTFSRFLFEKVTEHSNVDCISFNNFIMPPTLTDKEVHFMARLFPKLSALYCPRMDVSGFSALLEHFLFCGSNLLIEELQIPLVPAYFGSTSGKRRKNVAFFTKVISGMNNLKKLHLKASDEFSSRRILENLLSHDICLMKVCGDLVKRTQSLQSLSLESFKLSSPSALIAFLSGAFKALTLKSIEAVPETNNLSWQIENPDLSGWNAIQALELENIEFYHSWWQKFFAQLGTIACLKTLFFKNTKKEYGRSGDMTQTLVSCITSCKSLQRLGCFQEFVADARKVADAIANNTVLERVWFMPLRAYASKAGEDTSSPSTRAKMAESYNFDESEENEKIMYFTTLNRHGRGKLASRHVSLGAVVDCLVSVVDEVSSDEPDERAKFMYGLLHIVPAVWSCPHTQRQRQMSQGVSD